MDTSIKQLRLLLFPECDRACSWCCNKDWDLSALPKITDYRGYDIIMLTGGEPLLNPDLVINTIMDIREQNPDAWVYVYTAKTDDPELLEEILCFADGITLTLHEKEDGRRFQKISEYLYDYTDHCSLRLNVFAGIEVHGSTDGWNVKSGIKWIKDCPLPVNEVFGRL